VVRGDPLTGRHERGRAAAGGVTAYRSVASLQRDNRRCRLCVAAGYPLASLPVVQSYAGQRAYLLGQSPGAVEGEQRRPWRGRAGVTLRRWLQLGDDAFYATFYCAAVTRCYPGKAASGRGDRTPSAREQELCAGWRVHEVRLFQPELIVPVGGLALRRLLGISDLTGAVGKSYVMGDAIVVPLPHPSGASGWLNDGRNRARLGKALTHVRRELARLGDEPVPPSHAGTTGTV
jgi:uracil-DNA glycosylase family 4